MFLCTGNSCRSQMAEGIARELGMGLIEAHSAGISPQGVNPLAVAVMQEIGTDISNQASKSTDDALLNTMDIVITLCDNATEACPWTPPRIKRIHWPIEDPAKATGTKAEVMNEFRKTRDEIEQKIRKFIEEVRNG